MYVISIVFGLIIVISSIFMIRRELNRAILKREQLLEHSRVYKEDDLFKLLENLQISIDEMNNAFYEIANDLEEKYSQHEKEIQLLDEKVTSISTISKVNCDRIKPEEHHMESIAMHKTKMDLSKIEIEHKNQIEVTETFDLESERTLREKVIKRRSEGVSLKAIAKEFNIGMGELQLLIQLPDVTKKHEYY